MFVENRYIIIEFREQINNLINNQLLRSIRNKGIKIPITEIMETMLQRYPFQDNFSLATLRTLISIGVQNNDFYKLVKLDDKRLFKDMLDNLYSEFGEELNEYVGKYFMFKIDLNTCEFEKWVDSTSIMLKYLDFIDLSKAVEDYNG